MRRLLLVMSWVVAAAVTSGVAWGVLSSADREVGGVAQSPLLTIDLNTTSTTTTTTTSTVATTSTTTTSSIPSPTTTPPEWAQTTIPSPGGVVVIRHRPGEVHLDSATPHPGFAMEIDERGPDEVRVEFDNDDDSFEVRARWHDGALEIEVDD